MNRFVALPLLFVATFASAQASSLPPVSPSPAAPCEVLEQNGEAQSVRCAIPSAATPQRFRFKVNFSGGHDDTMASMQPVIDGRPVDCESGGKLRLMGEDGDVSLDCTFAVDVAAASQKVLDVRIKWSHAQYQNFEFVKQ